jgi:hypothetical protein
VIQFRATDDELAFLKDAARRRGTTVAAIVREAIDEWLARQGKGKRSSDSASRKTPSGVTQNEK